MGKIKYYFRVISKASFGGFIKAVKIAQERSGKNRLLIMLDIIACVLLYGAGYNDYVIFAFWDMKRAQRRTYLTRLVNKRLVMLANNQAYKDVFDKKDEFYKRFDKYLKREYICLPSAGFETFCEFFERKQNVIAKPREGESGKGIELLKYPDYKSNLRELYDRLLQKDIAVIEDIIKQHPAMAELYPHAVNSLRIVTLVTNGVAELVYAVCKMGSGGRFVDNLESGGMCCPIDLETGKICGVAHTSALINYEKHPQTGVTFIGYPIPFVNEAVELCKQAALEIPEFRYVGWDAAITEKGPLIIEGNDYPGYDFWQLPEHTPDKIGLKPFFKQRIPEL